MDQGLHMQPCLVAEQWVCKRNEKSTAGAAQRASGDRLFFMKSAEGNALRMHQRLTPDGRDKGVKPWLG